MPKPPWSLLYSTIPVSMLQSSQYKYSNTDIQMTTCQLQMCTVIHKVLIGRCAWIPVVNTHINQPQHCKHNITSGAWYPGVPSGRMEANLIIWSVGSFMPSPGTVLKESKSPSLTKKFELHLQLSGWQWQWMATKWISKIELNPQHNRDTDFQNPPFISISVSTKVDQSY